MQNPNHKTCATLSAVVAGVCVQRRAELRLLNCQGWNLIGRVTIPPNCPLPAVGAVVEIQYLSASRQNNLAHEPRYLGQRPDIEPYQCIMAQLTHRMSWRAF